MGDVKREIVMLVDTMNTVARIEEACRTTAATTSPRRLSFARRSPCQ
jgi:hypothetical protein